MSENQLLSGYANGITPNSYIDEIKHKTMKVTNLGIWYQRIPSGIIVNPLGEIVQPKLHNGSWYVVIKRKPVAVSNPRIPKLTQERVMEFKRIFL